MRVTATARCFYKGLREKGDVFECDLEELPPFMEAEEQAEFAVAMDAEMPVVSKKPAAKKKATKPDAAEADTPVSE